MPSYRCYFMSGETIQGVQILECADDSEVILKAAAVLDAHPEHQNVEVWDGKRMLARVSRQAKKL